MRGAQRRCRLADAILVNERLADAQPAVDLPPIGVPGHPDIGERQPGVIGRHVESPEILLDHQAGAGIGHQQTGNPACIAIFAAGAAKGRAVRGGVGEAKCAGNYAAGFLAQREAAANGCDQVVWLDAIDRETVEEMGGMNVCFVFNTSGKPTMVTPKASGSLLKGITRDTLLTLAHDLGYAVEERRITFEDIF